MIAIAFAAPYAVLAAVAIFGSRHYAKKNSNV